MKRVRAVWRANPFAVACDCLVVAIAAWAAIRIATDAASSKPGDAIWACALVLAGGIIWARLGHWRDDPDALRAELLHAAKKIGRRQIWLNRGERVVFRAWRGPEGTHLRVFPEDDLLAIRDGSPGAVVYVTYVMPRAGTAVYRVVEGAKVTMGAGEVTTEADRGGHGWRPWRDAIRLALEARKGRLDATPQEIATVIRQLRDAELIASGRL